MYYIPVVELSDQYSQIRGAKAARIRDGAKWRVLTRSPMHDTLSVLRIARARIIRKEADINRPCASAPCYMREFLRTAASPRHALMYIRGIYKQ